MTIQVDLVPNPIEGNINSPELSLLILPLHTITAISWLPPWISHLFHHGLLGATQHFYSLAVLD